MSDTVYTVEKEDGTKLYLAADSEDAAFQKLQRNGNTDPREALKFTPGKHGDVPEGADVL
jgi:hypothetical protein